MATTQIRDIAEDAYDIIRRRANAAGQSIQAYMRDQVVWTASQRTTEEVLDELEAARERDPSPGVTVQSVLETKDADRR